MSVSEISASNLDYEVMPCDMPVSDASLVVANRLHALFTGDETVHGALGESMAEERLAMGVCEALAVVGTVRRKLKLPRLSPDKRLDTVRQLRLRSMEDYPLERPLYYFDDLEYLETHASPYAPTLGIEIEIFNTTLGLPEKGEHFYPIHKQRQQELTEKFELTKELGVPQGADGFWEFANAPASHYQTLTREVQSLIDMGLINMKYTDHPLDVTVGGVTSAGKIGRQAYVFIRALEASGWSTSGSRLLDPHIGKKNSWDYFGDAGIRERRPEDVEGVNNKAIEIRTMQLQSLTGLHRLLSSAYYVGGALRAYQEERNGTELRDGITEDGRAELAEIWLSLSDQVRRTFTTYQMASPEYSSRWKVPTDSNRSRFFRLAKLLDQSTVARGSEGGRFVSEIRGTLTRARVQAAKIMVPSLVEH